MDSSIQIEQTAAAWLARRDGDEWTDADQAQLGSWLDASIAHRVAFIRLEAAWRQALRLKALGAGAPVGVIPAPARWRFSPFFNRARSSSVPTAVVDADRPLSTSTRAVKLRRWALAASIILTVGVLVWSGDFLRARQSYSTAVGGLASVPMSDGSKVTLNTNSEIRVAVTDTERHVDLEQGEAFFQVAKDPSRPFVVRAGDERIIAVGTQFSVRRDANSVQVIVTEGRVRVEQAGGKSARVPPAELSAGSVARSGGEGVLIQRKPVREVEDYLSWRSGYLIFRETSLAEAVAEFNRYNARKIVIEDSAVAEIRIGGNFRSDNVEAFLRLLQDGFDVHVENRGEQLVLKRG
jgi:transmembrane sensor